MKFLLMVLLVYADGAQPLHFQPFESLAECEGGLAAAVKQIPKRADVNFIAVCARIRNGSETSV